jgi:hypothetical protein
MALRSTIAMSRVEEVLRDAESLEPSDRLRLIALLWASLPPDHLAAPSAYQLAEIRRQFGGADADPFHNGPWDTVQSALNPGWDAEPQKLYHATRRFDLATIFVAMAVYSVLLGLMSLAQFEPVTKIYLGAFIVVIGVGQALLEPYVDARRASMIVGAAFHTVCSLVFWSVTDARWFPDSFFVVVVLNGLGLGALMGYMSGALVGGIYLLADVLRGKFGRAPDDNPAANTFDDVQLTPVHPLDNIGTPGP